MNNVLSQFDKKGGRPYPHWLIAGFQAVVEECELHDVDLEGYPYTWERGHETNDWIEVRLDRALVSSLFLQNFSASKLTNLEVSTSDPCPIFFEPFTTVAVNTVKHFRFENAWLREPMCFQIVKDTWELHQEKTLQQKLLMCSEILSVWGKEITGNFKQRINQHKKVMRTLKGRRDAESVQKYRDASKQLTEVYSQQEIFWRQRPKQLWLRE